MRFYVYEGNLKKEIEFGSYNERNAFNKDISLNTDRFNVGFGDKTSRQSSHPTSRCRQGRKILTGSGSLHE